MAKEIDIKKIKDPGAQFKGALIVFLVGIPLFFVHPTLTFFALVAALAMLVTGVRSVKKMEKWVAQEKAKRQEGSASPSS